MAERNSSGEPQIIPAQYGTSLSGEHRDRLGTVLHDRVGVDLLATDIVWQFPYERWSTALAVGALLSDVISAQVGDAARASGVARPPDAIVWARTLALDDEAIHGLNGCANVVNQDLTAYQAWFRLGRIEG